MRFACILNAAFFSPQKPASAGPSSKPVGATAAAAARSRLAAAKAAMKAKQQAAETAAKEDAAIGEETSCPDTQEPRPQGDPAASSSVPLDEGLSLANSPLKPPGQSLTFVALMSSGISVLLCNHVANLFTTLTF